MNVGDGRRASTHNRMTERLVQQRVSLYENCVKTTRKVSGAVHTAEHNYRQISANNYIPCLTFIKQCVCVCVEFVCITSPVERVVSRFNASDSYQGKVRHSYQTPKILMFAVFLLSISSTNTGSYFSSIMTASFHIRANSLFTSLPSPDASRFKLSYWQRCQPALNKSTNFSKDYPLYNGFPSPKIKFLHLFLSLVSSTASRSYVLFHPSIHPFFFGSSLSSSSVCFPF